MKLEKREDLKKPNCLDSSHIAFSRQTSSCDESLKEKLRNQESEYDKQLIKDIKSKGRVPENELRSTQLDNLGVASITEDIFRHLDTNKSYQILFVFYKCPSLRKLPFKGMNTWQITYLVVIEQKVFSDFSCILFGIGILNFYSKRYSSI